MQERLARWAGMGNNSRGSGYEETTRKMQDEMDGAGLCRRGEVVSSARDRSRVVSEADAAQIELEQLKG